MVVVVVVLGPPACAVPVSIAASARTAPMLLVLLLPGVASILPLPVGSILALATAPFGFFTAAVWLGASVRGGDDMIWNGACHAVSFAEILYGSGNPKSFGRRVSFCPLQATQRLARQPSSPKHYNALRSTTHHVSGSQVDASITNPPAVSSLNSPIALSHVNDLPNRYPTCTLLTNITHPARAVNTLTASNACVTCP